MLYIKSDLLEEALYKTKQINNNDFIKMLE